MALSMSWKFISTKALCMNIYSIIARTWKPTRYLSVGGQRNKLVHSYKEKFSDKRK
jgi:hypothetical protein